MIVGGVGLRRVVGGTMHFSGTTKFRVTLLFCAGPPYQTLTIQLSHPLFLLAPGPARFARMAVVTCPSRRLSAFKEVLL